MSKTIFDYIEDKEKVLIGKGDLYMLMHTLVAYFGLQDAPTDFTIDCLETICRRNMYTQEFVNDFIAFQKIMIDENTHDELEKKMAEMDEDDNLRKSVKEMYDWLKEDEEDEQKEDEQDN